MKKIDISEIDYSLPYDGYYWYSNKQKPEIIIGNSFTKDIFTSLHAGIALIFQKFIILPAITIIVLQFIDLPAAVKSVILIESFMPAAVYSVVASIIYDLDSKLASRLFVLNTVFFIIAVLPLMMVFREYI